MRHTRSSNKQIRKWQLNTIALAMTILLCACGGGGSAPEINNVSVSNGLSADHEYRPGTGVVPEGGNWTASSMAFTVSADGSQVDHFEVSYSGRAHNDTCDFDYSDVVSVTDLVVEDGRFVYDSDELVIEGHFTETREAEVTVLWFGYYGGGCDVFYNGELTEAASLSVVVAE